MQHRGHAIVDDDGVERSCAIRQVRARSGAGLLVAALMFAACGGGDGGSDGSVPAENGPDDAIGGLSAETRYDIVAGQLDPEPTVEIDGDDIRLVFSGGSVADAQLGCIVASVTQVPSETVTLVYPDGEEAC